MCPAFPPAEHACGIMPQLPLSSTGGRERKRGIHEGGRGEWGWWDTCEIQKVEGGRWEEGKGGGHRRCFDPRPGNCPAHILPARKRIMERFLSQNGATGGLRTIFWRQEGKRKGNKKHRARPTGYFKNQPPILPCPFSSGPLFLLPLSPPPARSEQADDPPRGKVDVHVVKARARRQSGDGHDVSRQRVQEACPDAGSDLADGDFEARGDAWGGGERA